MTWLRATVLACAVSWSACGSPDPAGGRGAGEAGAGGGAPGGGGGEAPAPMAIAGPVLLLPGSRFTSHALAVGGEVAGEVQVVATRETRHGTAISWVRLSGTGNVSPPAAIDSFPGEGPGLVLGALPLGERRGLLAMSDAETLVSLLFDFRDGERIGGSTAGTSPPPRPFRPSAIRTASGFLVLYNGPTGIRADHVGEAGADSYGGFLPGFDPFVVEAAGAVWAGWNDTNGAVVSPLSLRDAPFASSPVALGPAANGPVLAAGPHAVLALTWGDTLDAQTVGLDPPALHSSTTVATQAIAGRPAALPWDGGFLVLWADAAGTTLRGRLLDAEGTPSGPAFVVQALDEPVSLEPCHAVGNEHGAWLSWADSGGLHAVLLMRSRH